MISYVVAWKSLGFFVKMLFLSINLCLSCLCKSVPQMKTKFSLLVFTFLQPCIAFVHHQNSLSGKNNFMDMKRKISLELHLNDVPNVLIKACKINYDVVLSFCAKPIVQQKSFVKSRAMKMNSLGSCTTMNKKKKVTSTCFYWEIQGFFIRFLRWWLMNIDGRSGMKTSIAAVFEVGFDT